MTFRHDELVFWVRPSITGDGSLEQIPARVVWPGRFRVTIEAWGQQGTVRVVRVSPECLRKRETIGDVLDRIDRAEQEPD